MARPRRDHEVIKITAEINADVKQRMDDYVLEHAGTTQLALIEEALTTFLNDELGGGRVIRFRVSDELDAELRPYSENEERHSPRRSNIARDALNILLRTRNDTQSREFVVNLRDEELVDRFAIYRHVREWDRSRVTEKALDRYLLEEERSDARYSEALASRRNRGHA
jgi:hypothetical protein